MFGIIFAQKQVGVFFRSLFRGFVLTLSIRKGIDYLPTVNQA